MSRRCLVTTIPVVFVISLGAATAADFEEYTRLSEAANAAHANLEGASEDLLPALRENALQRDVEVIEWLDEFFATDEFQTLPQEQQGLAYRDRYRNEYNAARLLIQLDRCDEARTRARTLLDSPINDAQLRPRLTETYEEAVQCANRSRTATLVVDAVPANAELFVDGELVGLSTARPVVDLGEHTLQLRADGYESYERSFEARSEGEEVQVGPIVLDEISSGGVPPRWYEWTLWGVGVAGITTGIVAYTSARDRENQIEEGLAQDPPLTPADPEAEQDKIDQLDAIAYAAGGVGLAAGITGTILYFVRRSRTNNSPNVSFAPGLLADGPGFFLSVDL